MYLQRMKKSWRPDSNNNKTQPIEFELKNASSDDDKGEKNKQEDLNFRIRIAL